MSQLLITVGTGTVQTVQLGTLSAAVNQQITQAVAASAASAAAAAAYVAELPSLVVQQVASHASLPAAPAGLYLVLSDETRGNVPQLYYFWSTHCMWFAALQVA